jgi:hypothetical protein
MGSQLAIWITPLSLGLIAISALALAITSLQRDRRARAANERSVPPLFHAFSDEVGRVAEEGTSIHVALGNGGLLSEESMVSVAALQGIRGLTELSAAYDTPPIITTGDPTLYVLADNQIRETHMQQGSIDHYRASSVRFVAPTPTLYAAAAATLCYDERIGTNVSLGSFGPEVSLITHAAASKHIRGYGGATSAPGVAALYPELEEDDLVIGEELFAGGAGTGTRPYDWAGLKAQDLLRWLVIAGIVIVAALSLLGYCASDGVLP